MRITNFDKVTMTQTRLSDLSQYSNKLAEQMTTGKQFQKISESPVKANTTLLVTSGIKRIEQFQTNLSDLTGYLQTAESYLASAEDTYQRVSELGLQAANGTYNDDDRKSFVLEIENLIEHMVGIGNSKYLNKYLFAGQKVDVKPLDYDGAQVTYNGSANVNNIRISANMEIEVSVTADQAFVGMIGSMIELRDAINAGVSQDIGTALENVQTSGENVLNARSELGVRMTTVDMVEDSYNTNELELKTRRSKAEDADVAEVISQYMNAQTLYEAAVQSTLKMYQNSLLNYM